MTNKKTLKHLRSDHATRLIATAYDTYRAYLTAKEAGESGKGPICSPLASAAQSLMSKAFRTLDGKARKATKAFNKGPQALGNAGLKALAAEAQSAAHFMTLIDERIGEALNPKS